MPFCSRGPCVCVSAPLRWAMLRALCLPPLPYPTLPSPLPPARPALHCDGTPGFMASDRKSMERTVCNPTITLLPNQETVIQSLGLYLNKTGLQPRQQRAAHGRPRAETRLSLRQKFFYFLIATFTPFINSMSD